MVKPFRCSATNNAVLILLWRCVIQDLIKLCLQLADWSTSEDLFSHKCFAACFEAEIHLNINPDEVYEILKLHFEGFFGANWKATRMEHSYDRNQKVYRFESDSQGKFCSASL